MLEFSTGTALTPYPSLPGKFHGKIRTKRQIYVTDVKAVSMKGAKGRVMSYKITDIATGVKTNDLSAGIPYDIEVKLDSYPRYFHNMTEIANDYGTLELISFEDANGRGRLWIPELQIDGEPATDKWIPLTSPEGAVCMIAMPEDERTGNELRNAGVWVDGVDIHRHAPGDIYFCKECMCGAYTTCEFGEHDITIKKKGYNDFSQLVVLENGDLVNVQPIMSRVQQVEGLGKDISPGRTRPVVKITLYK